MTEQPTSDWRTMDTTKGRTTTREDDLGAADAIGDLEPEIVGEMRRLARQDPYDSFWTNEMVGVVVSEVDRLTAELAAERAKVQPGGVQPRRQVGCTAEGPLVSAPCIRLVHGDGKHDDGRGTRWFEPPACPSGCGCRWGNDADRNDCACDGICCTEEWYLLSDGVERPDWVDPFDREDTPA